MLRVFSAAAAAASLSRDCAWPYHSFNRLSQIVCSRSLQATMVKVFALGASTQGSAISPMHLLIC
jgi:hypothetical protein